MEGLIDMTYDIKLIRRDELQTSQWSGGKTTQLAIFPINAKYDDRNFTWRLSSAKVEVEESTFTSLPNISRIIMIIEGKLLLEHEGYHSCVLNPYEQDSFSGNWNTKSYGKVTDFNLMMKKGCNGNLEPVFIEKDNNINFIFKSGKDFNNYTQALYCTKGEIQVKFSEDEIINVNQGDILIITLDKLSSINYTIVNKKDEKVNIIKANIMC